MPVWQLVVCDVDSTLIQAEVIELLADQSGHRAEIERVTAAAMRGEVDFEHSLRQRVALLAGLDAMVFDHVGRNLPVTPGARALVRELHARGVKVGTVSGGFTQVTDYLVRDLALDFAVANTLEIDDGVLTGRLVGPVVDRAGKASALRTFAARYHVPLEHTVAIGDGANDIDMLTAAGFSIAFNAKPAVGQYATARLDGDSLDPVLRMLGFCAPAPDFTCGPGESRV